MSKDLGGFRNGCGHSTSLLTMIKRDSHANSMSNGDDDFSEDVTTFGLETPLAKADGATKKRFFRDEICFVHSSINNC